MSNQMQPTLNIFYQQTCQTKLEQIIKKTKNKTVLEWIQIDVRLQEIGTSPALSRIIKTYPSLSSTKLHF